jgi:chromosome segregation ATPase
MALSKAELNLDLGLTVAAADYQTLLDELAQAQALDRERCTRIHHLEQALDQALICLEELRSQVQHQQLLETQLANTEDYASVQQQAIVRLKLQLAEQQQALDAQILETQQRDQAIQELLATIESMTQAQQREVERLRSRLAQDQLEVQSHRSRLGKHLQDLQTALESRQQRVSELEVETLAARTLSTRLQGQLEMAQQQIKELSTRLSQNRSHLEQFETQLEQSASGRRLNSPTAGDEIDLQLAQQAQWQQQQQELEADRNRLQIRLNELEQQVAEMQEQILQQAQQEAEYETAVQYWKDRHASCQRQISHLKDVVKDVAEQLLPHPIQELNPLLGELLTTLQISLPTAKPESQPIAPLPLPRLTTVELPEFLMRRRAAQMPTPQKGAAPESVAAEPLPNSHS